MAPSRPASRDAPSQLMKRDLDAERQTSLTTQISKNKEPQEDSANGENQSTKVGSTTTMKKTDKKIVKASKTSKVAVVSDDQFNDIGEISKPTSEKIQVKARPASAGIGQAKPSPAVRPASAGAMSPTRTTDKQTMQAKVTTGDAVPSKLAFGETTFDGNDAVSEANENNERSLGDKEPSAKGLYDIFIQTRRCEQLCYEVGLKLKHIRKMKKKFDDNDMYHTGEITQAEFFYILNEDRRPLTTGIFQYGNVSPDQKFLSFDEYLMCIVSFAVLTPPEVYQYAFDLYDADQSGTLDEYEFAKMSKEMQSKQFHFPKNSQMAIKMIGGNDNCHVSEDGLVDLGEFMKFAKLIPVAFFPLFNFQKNVRKSTLSESKWSQLAARKLKIQELVSHMRRNYGAIPELSLSQRLWSLVDDEIHAIRKRASEIYGLELNQRRLIGDSNGVQETTG